MIRKFISVLSLLCSVTYACSTVQYMTVEQQNGNKYSFLLKDNPVITYENSSLVVNGNASTSYAITGVKNYHFTENDMNGVENISNEMLRIISLDDATIEIQNAMESTYVRVLSVNGTIMSTTKIDANGEAIVNLPQQKGVYVLNVGYKSVKIIRK